MNEMKGNCNGNGNGNESSDKGYESSQKRKGWPIPPSGDFLYMYNLMK
jgi:hypothetical protein